MTVEEGGARPCVCPAPEIKLQVPWLLPCLPLNLRSLSCSVVLLFRLLPKLEEGHFWAPLEQICGRHACTTKEGKCNGGGTGVQKSEHTVYSVLLCAKLRLFDSFWAPVYDYIIIVYETQLCRRSCSNAQ